MDFVYPVDFAGEKSGKFQFVPLPGTIDLRRKFARINAESIRSAKGILETADDVSVRIELTTDENAEYTVRCAQLVADHTGMTSDEVALLSSPWDSDFWAIQPIEEVEAVIKIFRGRNNV